MPHKVYGQPDHKLDRVTTTLWLPRRANNFRASLLVQGYASTKRATLWSHREDWPDPLEVVGMSLTDAAAHVTLIAVQDQPTSQDLFDYHLRGGKQYEEQQQLF